MTAGGLRIEGTAVLSFAPHVRFRFDETRKAWIVLAPERLLLPDEPAVEILRLIDGERDVDVIIDERLCFQAKAGAFGERCAVELISAPGTDHP